MYIHIIGICGTFMGGLALLAKAAGHRVSGCDANVYPPMSTQLQAAGIELMQGFKPEHLDPVPDMIVVGNVMSRGQAMIEHVLNQGLPYTSGPQWLAEHVLRDKWVLACSGTHGKTSTSAMLAWVLEYAGMAPGFLIGGVPENFAISARLGETPFFVVEADEYDTAFFDKRSKFVHYRPRTLIINNLEYDHADIFPDIAAIQRQFHHLIRTVPGEGLIIAPAQAQYVDETLAQGCWTPLERVNGDWTAAAISADGCAFDVLLRGERQGRLTWTLMGQHNIDNALAVIAAARHVGVPPALAITALSQFKNVKRRMEVKGVVQGITVYDDFAHHPTAIATTLQGLRAKVGAARIIAVLEPRSNSMRMGAHKDGVLPALQAADAVWLYLPEDVTWDVQGEGVQVRHQLDTLPGEIAASLQPGDHVLIMSNGGFGGIHAKLLQALESVE